MAVPFEQDNGCLYVLDEFRFYHDARDPFLGPHRYQPSLDADTCARLATTLAWTAAVADVPFVGGLLLLAGVYQMTSLKRELLTHCRSCHTAFLSHCLAPARLC